MADILQPSAHSPCIVGSKNCEDEKEAIKYYEGIAQNSTHSVGLGDCQDEYDQLLDTEQAYIGLGPDIIIQTASRSLLFMYSSSEQFAKNNLPNIFTDSINASECLSLVVENDIENVVQGASYHNEMLCGVKNKMLGAWFGEFEPHYDSKHDVFGEEDFIVTPFSLCLSSMWNGLYTATSLDESKYGEFIECVLHKFNNVSEEIVSPNNIICGTNNSNQIVTDKHYISTLDKKVEEGKSANIELITKLGNCVTTEFAATKIGTTLTIDEDKKKDFIEVTIANKHVILFNIISTFTESNLCFKNCLDTMIPGDDIDLPACATWVWSYKALFAMFHTDFDIDDIHNPFFTSPAYNNYKFHDCVLLLLDAEIGCDASCAEDCKATLKAEILDPISDPTTTDATYQAFINCIMDDYAIQQI